MGTRLDCLLKKFRNCRIEMFMGSACKFRFVEKWVEFDCNGKMVLENQDRGVEIARRWFVREECECLNYIHLNKKNSRIISFVPSRIMTSIG